MPIKQIQMIPKTNIETVINKVLTQDQVYIVSTMDCDKAGLG